MNHREPGEFGDGATIVRHTHRYGVTSTIVGGARVDDVVGEPLVLRDLYMEGNSEFADVMVGSTVFIDGRAVFRRTPLAERYADFKQRLARVMGGRA